MNDQEYKKHIVSEVAHIMLKFPHMFPIVEKLKTCPIQNTLLYFIYNYIGLECVAAEKIRAFNTLRFAGPVSIAPALQGRTILSILHEYMATPSVPADHEEYNKMISSSGLILE